MRYVTAVFLLLPNFVKIVSHKAAFFSIPTCSTVLKECVTFTGAG